MYHQDLVKTQAPGLFSWGIGVLMDCTPLSLFRSKDGGHTPTLPTVGD